MFDEVSSDEAFFAACRCGQVARQTMQIHAHHGCLFRAVALRQQPREEARQHIAHAGRGHARIACGVEVGIIGCSDDRFGSFENDGAVEFFGFLFLKLYSGCSIFCSTK